MGVFAERQVGCQHCGAEIPAGDQFCGRCGGRADPVASVEAPAAQPPPFDRQAWRPPNFGVGANAMPAQAYADFGIRLAAWLLDGLIVAALGIPAGVGLAFLIGASASGKPDGDAVGLAMITGLLGGFAAVWFFYTWIMTASGGGWASDYAACGLSSRARATRRASGLR